MNHGHHSRYVTYGLILLGIAFILLCVSFYEEFNQLRHLQILRFQQGWISAFRSRAPLTQDDVSMIQPWMTFDYVNRVFNIPPDYLKTALHVSDAAYPRISLSHYAKSHAINSAVFVEQVKTALRAHFAP
jgi:hypothetical protein